ncbi:mitochondrial enolase superfamily member 1 [Grus japonensis]|uniref:Mitochondrial enolase superfamily member 1 n=1 Tax=Grus japonensis TaxID=30415 RepID=A0ABC9W3T2_GRUJA
MSLQGHSQFLLSDHGNCEKCLRNEEKKTTSVFKKGEREDPGNYKPVTLIPGKVMKQLILETISRHMKDKKMIRSSQHGFAEGNSHFTNLIIFHDEMTGLVEKGRALDIIYLHFNKTFNSVSCKILIEKLMKYGLDKQ